jgi:hypothetical protein
MRGSGLSIGFDNLPAGFWLIRQSAGRLLADSTICRQAFWALD